MALPSETSIRTRLTSPMSHVIPVELSLLRNQNQSSRQVNPLLAPMAAMILCPTRVSPEIFRAVRNKCANELQLTSVRLSMLSVLMRLSPSAMTKSSLTMFQTMTETTIKTSIVTILLMKRHLPVHHTELPEDVLLYHKDVLLCRKTVG
jgi:hypothetical protein